MRMYLTVSLFVIVLILSLGSEAFAVTRTSSQSGSWSASSTWGGNPAPVAGDDVIINGGFTVTVDVSNAACLSLQLGGSTLSTGSGTISFTSGSQLTISGALTLGASNNAGNLSMSGGGTLQCEGFVDNLLGTWAAGTGTIVLTASNTIPNNNKIAFNNLTVSSGTTVLSRNFNVDGNLTINPAAVLDGGTNTLTLSGDWANNGTFTGNTGTVTFAKNGNQTITGTGANNFNQIRVNMGAAIANTLEVLATNFSAPDPFLTLTNGTFKISGTFTFSNSFFTGPSYNIQPTAGFWINNPNVTVSAQGGGASVRGLLRVSSGNYNIGTSVDNTLDYVTGSTIMIEGGSLTIAGRLTRSNATATTSYTQSGGKVTVVGQGSTDATFAGFDLGAVGSSFTMSGGTLVVRNATSASSDFLNNASTSSVTGGTLQIGDAATSDAQTIRIQSARPVGNLLVSNATAMAGKPTAQLVGSGLNVVGSVTIQPGTSLNANGQNLSVGGDWADSGTFTSGANTVTFNGAGAQALIKSGGETFNNLTVTKAAGTLILNNSAMVNNAFSLTQGTIAIGANTLTLNGAVSGGGTLTSGATGTVDYNQGSAGQSVLSGTYGNLAFSDFNKTLAATGTIGIAGTFTPGIAGGHTVTGSTIDFNGGSQTVPDFPYNNLSLSGSGTKTGSASITVNGTLTNNTGIVFSGMTDLNLNSAAHTNNGTLSAGTLTIGAGAVYTNNGTTTASSGLGGTGTLAQGATALLNIGGTAGITTLDASAAGNTVNYTGAAQSVKSVTYHHLSLSGSGTPTLTGVSTINGNFTLSGSVTPSAATGMTVGGNFTIGSGTSFDAGSFSHTLNGDWSNAGTFIAGTSTFTLSGTSPQSMSGSTFNNLSIANASGVTMLSDDTVDNTLTLTSGSFTIGPHTLTLNGAIAIGGGSLAGSSASDIVIGGSGASTSLPAITLNNLTLNRPSGASLGGDATIDGALTITNGTLNTGANAVVLGPAGTLSEPPGQPVIGNVRTTRNIASTSGTETFGSIGIDLLLNGVAPGNTSVSRKTGTLSTGTGHSSILRYFDVIPATNTGLNAGLVFHYDSTELNAQNGTILELYRSRDNGTTWNNLGGAANTTSKTVTITGINDFSRWTAADTSNRIGNTATPTTTGILPPSRTISDSGFALTVNGSEFVNGKSTVQFNGTSRATTYLSSTQLTASIPSGDLLVAGPFPVTVFTTGGGGTSNAQQFTVIALPPTKVRIETAGNGTGAVVPAQPLASGSSITVYAVTRDTLNNFVANVAATAWTLENSTGGVAAGDLVPAVDGKSAVFTAHFVGSATIKATSGGLPATGSGIITVTPGGAAKVLVETEAAGLGTVVPAETLMSGSSLTVYAITRDSLNNFVANVAATAWTLENITGSVVAGDLVPAVDGKSAVFTAHLVGSATIKATSGGLTTISSATIQVTPATGVGKEQQPLTYRLMQNYPNPFNPNTTIRYQIPKQGQVTLRVFDMVGREVATLVNRVEEPGDRSVTFDASGLSSGMYYYRLQAGRYVEVRKLLLVR